MARILCIEDSKEFQIYLTATLSEHTLVIASSLAEALRLASCGKDSFDLLLMDISLPDGNGMKVLPQMLEVFADRPIPIIILSSDNDILTKVAAFGIGADDYMSKPPNSSELKARVAARLRSNHSAHKNRLGLGDLTMDFDRMSVEIAGTEGLVDLTPFEYKILKLLIGRPGQVFSRDQIIERVWGMDKHITTRTVDAHVSHLRKKLVKSQVLIETVLSAGYKVFLRDNRLSSGT